MLFELMVDGGAARPVSPTDDRVVNPSVQESDDLGKSGYRQELPIALELSLQRRINGYVLEAVYLRLVGLLEFLVPINQILRIRHHCPVRGNAPCRGSYCYLRLARSQVYGANLNCSRAIY